MKYLSEINAFNERIPIWRLSAGQIALWHALMSVANRTGWKQEFSVPNATLETMTGLSRRAILNDRKRLQELGLITVTLRGTQSTLYSLHGLAMDQDGSQPGSIDNDAASQDASQVSSRDHSQANAIDASLDTSRVASTDIRTDKTGRDGTRLDNGKEGAKAPQKVDYAEFVHMTPEEWGRLVKEYGEPAARRMVEILNNYKGSKGKTYKNDYRAILSWVVTRYQEEQAHREQRLQMSAKVTADKQYDDPDDFFAGGFSFNEHT